MFNTLPLKPLTKYKQYSQYKIEAYKGGFLIYGRDTFFGGWHDDVCGIGFGNITDATNHMRSFELCDTHGTLIPRVFIV